MIKVYLDWNCITHSKDKFAELKELLGRYNHIFICPYSLAHLRDLQTKSDTNPEEYEKDLDILTQICGSHMLYFSNDDLKLLNVQPREYISSDGDVLKFIQNDFSFPYSSIRDLVRYTIAQEDLERISKEDDPANVFPLINNAIQRNYHIKDDVDSLIEHARVPWARSSETRLKEMYYILDMFGYKSEGEKKAFANIDTDSLHIATACRCDYLITGDRKMRGKAKAIYSHINCTTRVMTPQSFFKEIPNIVEKCYAEDLIIDAIKQYGKPTLKNDGAHYQALEYPLWGTFHICLNANSLRDTLPNNLALFVPKKEFMFYDELMPLAMMASHLFPESEREAFVDKYIQSYTQSKPMGDIPFKLTTAKYIYDCVLTTFEGLPALRVQYECLQ